MRHAGSMLRNGSCMLRAGYGLFGVLCVFGLSPQVAAQRSLAQARTPLRQYQAPAECPVAAQFWREVQERSPRSEPPTVDVSVSIERQQGHYAAHLLLQDGQKQSERSVVGEDCDETSTAMALVVALGLAAQHHEQEPVDEGPSVRLSLEAEGVVDSAPAPQLAFGGGAGLRIATLDRKSEIGFALGYRGIGAHSLGQGFSVRVVSLRLDACPIAIGLSRSLSLMPCGFSDVGVLRAEAESGFRSNPGPVYEVWASLGVLARFDWRIAAPVTLALVPGVQAPLKRGYELATRAPGSDRSIALHVVPDWGFFGGIAARYDLD